VLEGALPAAFAAPQARSLEHRQLVGQRAGIQGKAACFQQCAQQFQRELAPEYGSDLGHRLGRTQPVQPRHQQVLKRSRHGFQRRGVGGQPLGAEFVRHARGLFQEQRYAVAARRQRTHQVGRQRRVFANPADQFASRLGRQAGQLDTLEPAPTRRHRVGFAARRHDDQQSRPAATLDPGSPTHPPVAFLFESLR
jgi:hypothetical protein